MRGLWHGSLEDSIPRRIRLHLSDPHRSKEEARLLAVDSDESSTPQAE
jgi:hypothetical protein